MPYRVGTTIGKFRIERLLSNDGATAQVYLANNGMQQVALKIARVNDKGYIFQDHLRQEVEALQCLDHLGVVHLFPVMDEDVYTARAENLTRQPWYFVMEYIAGKSLAGHLRRITKTFPLKWRLGLFRSVVESVAYLHEQGYAHCDLKPEHIFLRHIPSAEQTPQAVLIDFGSSCVISETPPMLAASVPYAAPELLRALENPDAGQLLNTAALDMWSLGAILYELATGRRLIAGYRQRSIIRNVLNERFDLGSAPTLIQPMLAKMLHMNVDARAAIQEVQFELNKL
jgi:serine/threonine protein kinase